MINIALVLVGLLLIGVAIFIEKRKSWYLAESILGINMIFLGIYT